MNWLNGKSSQRVVNALLNAAVAATIVVLSLFLFAGAMTKELGRDEHMYCTAGYLAAQGKVIYRDFSYVAQLPYHPVILAALYRITGTSHYLLVGRGFSVVCEVGILVCIAGICRNILKRFPLWAAGFAIAGTVIYAMNPFVIYASGYAWNHSVVILCLLICLWLFVELDFDRMDFWRLCTVGALLTFATFNRPTAALVYAVFAVTVIILAPGRLKKGKVTALPFIVGSFVFALLPLAVIARAPRAFLLNVVRIPALNAAFLNEVGWVYNKLRLTTGALLSECYSGLIVLGVYLAVALFLHRHTITLSDKWKGWFCAAVTAAVIAGVFIPPTMWLQYWAMPAAFIVILLARPFGCVCQTVAQGRMKRLYLLIPAAILATLVVMGVYENSNKAVADFRGLFDTEKWVPLQVHGISEDIRAGIVSDEPVLTLAPLYAIEGGSRIYPQFSAGSFVYRIADRLRDSEKRIVHAAGADDLKELTRMRPPAAVVLGTEPALLEEPIFRQVVRADWHMTVYGQNGPFVYFRNTDNAASGTR